MEVIDLFSPQNIYFKGTTLSLTFLKKQASQF